MKRFSHRLTLEILEDRRLLATCHVVRLGDFGAGADLGGGHSRGDLRYCINKANDEPGADVIDITATGQINLRGPLPDLSSDIDMRGPGANLLTVRRSAGGNYRIFTILDGANVSIYGVTISNGLGQTDGGGILNNGVLTLVASAVIGNTASGSGTGRGGGIYNDGSLTVLDSLIANNVANSSGNLVTAFGGGIASVGGTLMIVNSTISSNTSTARTARGGGIAFNNTGSANISNTTIADNKATANACCGLVEGGGIWSASNILTLGNTIIARNGVQGDNSEWVNCPDIRGNSGSTGFNLIGSTICGSGFSPSDILGVDPLLGPLQDNGGPTQTMALQPGSPAIDAGDPNPINPPDWDQRGPGFPRIVNGRIDIGAFEVQATGAPSFDGLAVLVTADWDADNGIRK